MSRKEFPGKGWTVIRIEEYIQQLTARGLSGAAQAVAQLKKPHSNYCSICNDTGWKVNEDWQETGKDYRELCKCRKKK